MADESEPESRPITVSELIARSEGDDAFPKSSSLSVRRAGASDDQDAPAGATASGMPSHRPPAAKPERQAPRVVGASGMPGFTPPAREGDATQPEPGPEANRVTGIIPIVVDDDVDTGSLRAVEADDVVGYDLPPAEIRSSSAADQPDYFTRDGAQPAGQPVSPFEDTTAIPLVDDEPLDDFEAFDDSAEPTAGDDAVASTALPAAGASALGATAAGAALVGDDADGRGAGGADPKAEKARAKDEAKAERARAKAAKARAKSVDKAARQRRKDASQRDAEPSPAIGWLAFAGELILGLAVGAGLFWGFTELWKRYVYLALILAIVVIFAIVTFAHVLRKRDLPTTLLALGVGMLVTIGPLVLLAAQP